MENLPIKSEEPIVSPKTFFLVWVILMVLTVFEITAGYKGIAGKDYLILILMLGQAYLVSFYFMHLRFENLPLILSVVLGVLLTIGLLCALIIWDGTHIIQLSR